MQPILSPIIAPDNLILRIGCLADPFIAPNIVFLSNIGFSDLIIIEEICWISYLEPKLLDDDKLAELIDFGLSPYLCDILEEYESEELINGYVDPLPYTNALIMVGTAIYREIAQYVKATLPNILAELQASSDVVENVFAETLYPTSSPLYDCCDIKITIQFDEDYDAERQRNIRMRGNVRPRLSNVLRNVSDLQSNGWNRTHNQGSVNVAQPLSVTRVILE